MDELKQLFLYRLSIVDSIEEMRDVLIGATNTVEREIRKKTPFTLNGDMAQQEVDMYSDGEDEEGFPL